MKVSVNWMKQFGGQGLDVPIDELVARIGEQLGAVEAVENMGDKYHGVLVAKVVSCERHPNADRLHVCKIDDGGKAEGVERDENGLVQVVCGAPNVREGLWVAWLPPGAPVPDSVGKEPFVLEARELRGVVSNGMLASPRELALGDSHDGILELRYGDVGASHTGQGKGTPAVTDVSTTPQHGGDYARHSEAAAESPKVEGVLKRAQHDALEPGEDFAKAYGLDDYVIDIENKMFTHRPDCFGQLGVAREIAGISGQRFTSPAWYLQPEFSNLTKPAESLPLTVHNELPELVARFMAVVMSGIEIKPSPVQLQTYLQRVGIRPINNVVDVTNYLMMLTGQPLHAYDYDKVKSLSEDDGAALVVRYPRDSERLKLLNGKEIIPRPEAIMIATDKQLIGVGGVMGGADTEVDEITKNIILEVATFDMYSVRRTSMAHGLFTDAVSRFNKGQSPLQNDRILAKAMAMVNELANGQAASAVMDLNQVIGREWVHPPVPVSIAFINERLGFNLAPEDIKMLLENVEFKVSIEARGASREPHNGQSPAEQGDASQENTDFAQGAQDDAAAMLVVTAPFWRIDVETREDVVEEVGRLYGFDKLPLELPRRSILPPVKDPLLQLKAEIRSRLARDGANEVLTYSFVHGNLLEKTTQDTTLAFKLSNALSPDLQYFRTSLTPSLLEKIHPNVKAGYDRFALFELGRAHVVGELQPHEPEVPKEVNALALVYTGRTAGGAAYYEAKHFLTDLLEQFSVSSLVNFEPLSQADLYDNPWIIKMTAPFEPGRAAVLRDIGGAAVGTKGLIWGVVGEYKAGVRKALKLPEWTAGFELDPLLFTAASRRTSYQPLSRYPSIAQDISLRVPADIAFSHIAGLVGDAAQAARPPDTTVITVPIDIYQHAADAEHKNVAFRLRVTSYRKTLRDAEVSALLDRIATAAHERLGAERL